ncbi:MAG: hypothetical protein JRJ79_11785 [Deltaproteobacteria bacterium]|nr:hypothetical protein [Deltaproteobacteria bacterium]
MPAHKLNAVSGVGRRVRALKLPGVPGDGRRVAGGWQAGNIGSIRGMAMCQVIDALQHQ